MIFREKLTKHAELVTGTMYWSLVENGITIIAASLPTLYYFIGKRSAQSIVRSLRSIISLRSFRSNVSNTVQDPAIASYRVDPSFRKGLVDHGTYRVYWTQNGDVDARVSRPVDVPDLPLPSDCIYVGRQLHLSDSNMV